MNSFDDEGGIDISKVKIMKRYLDCSFYYRRLKCFI